MPFDINSILELGGKVLDKVLPESSKEKAEAQAKLQELAASGELKELQTYLADRADARAREVAIATSDKAPMLNKIIAPLIALGFIFIYAALTIGPMVASFFGYQMPAEAQMMVGDARDSVEMGVMLVLGYYYGSSVGSQNKDKAFYGPQRP